MTDYEKIRNACVKSNPEIMGLKFGCRVKLDVRGDDGVILQKSPYHEEPKMEYLYYNYDAQNVFIKAFIPKEILGRDIRLADICELARSINNFDQHSLAHLIWNAWDLKNDSLSSQTPETLKFIASLLPEV